MMKEAVPVSRLYLHSTDDDLCDASEVDMLIAHKRSHCVSADLMYRRYENKMTDYSLFPQPVDTNTMMFNYSAYQHVRDDVYKR